MLRREPGTPGGLFVAGVRLTPNHESLTYTAEQRERWQSHLRQNPVGAGQSIPVCRYIYLAFLHIE